MKSTSSTSQVGRSAVIQRQAASHLRHAALVENVAVCFGALMLYHDSCARIAEGHEPLEGLSPSIMACDASLSSPEEKRAE